MAGALPAGAAKTLWRQFRDACTQQVYVTTPTPREVTGEGLRILSAYMGKEKVREVLTHPRFRMAILTVRARYLTASENPVLRAAGLCGIMVHNLLSRKLIGLCLERTLFHDRKQVPPFAGSEGPPCATEPSQLQKKKRDQVCP